MQIVASEHCSTWYFTGNGSSLSKLKKRIQRTTNNNRQALTVILKGSVEEFQGVNAEEGFIFFPLASLSLLTGSSFDHSQNTDSCPPTKRVRTKPHPSLCDVRILWPIAERLLWLERPSWDCGRPCESGSATRHFAFEGPPFVCLLLWQERDRLFEAWSESWCNYLKKFGAPVRT